MYLKNNWFFRRSRIPRKNELFRIIIARLADKSGNIHLPNSKRTLEELFRFSQLCRVTQNVFMGKWKDDEAQKIVEWMN